MGALIDLNGLGHYKSKENAMVASVYSATKTYAVGDYAYYNGTLYRCTTAITTAEAWTSGHWTAAKIGDDVTELKTAITHHISSDILPTLPYKVYRENGVYKVEDIASKLRQQITTTYYIDYENGNNSNNGLTRSTAWKTFSKILSFLNNTSSHKYEFVILGNPIFPYIDGFGGTANRINIRNNDVIIIRAENTATLVGGVSVSGNTYTQLSENVYQTTLENVSGCVNLSNSNKDGFGIHKPMNKVSSVEDVSTTDESYFISGSTITIHSASINSIWLVVANNNSIRTVLADDNGGTLYFENLTFVGRNFIVSKQSKTAFQNAVTNLVLNKCVSEHSFQDNNLTIDSYDNVYCIECKCGYSKLDCFNYHGVYLTNPLLNKLVCEVNCFAEYAGYYNANGYSDNLSTVHDSMNVLRCGTNGQHCDAAGIADIDGCHTVNIDCNAINTYFTNIAANACNFLSRIQTAGYDGRDSIMQMQNCSYYDIREVPNIIADNLYTIGNDLSNVTVTNMYIMDKSI